MSLYRDTARGGNAAGLLSRLAGSRFFSPMQLSSFKDMNPMTTPLPATADDSSAPARRSGQLAERLASLAGIAGAAVVGMGEAQAVTYVPTAGVAAAQGIPGFSFIDASNITLGNLQPPATEGNTFWDVDGAGGTDFVLRNSSTTNARLNPASSVAAVLRTTTTGYLRNLNDGAVVGAAQSFWNSDSNQLTYQSSNLNPNFTTNTPGQLGFRFKNGSDTFYGWASLTITAAGSGQGFKITEAYYQTTAGDPINVGAVPVPEPAAMTLLALGSAGVMAWRGRKRGSAAAGES